MAETGGIYYYMNDAELEGYIYGNGNSNDLDTVTKIMSTSTNGIEGLPYQFMASVDRRIPNTEGYLEGRGVGRKYGERIFSRLPLLFLTPCEPLFMDDFDKVSRSNLAQGLIGGNFDSGLVEGVGRYYSVQFNYAEYYGYLNTMLACLSVYLGIQHETLTIGKQSGRIIDLAWQNELNDSFKTFFSAAENVIFYLDGMESVSETFTNDTTEPSLASQINGYSDQMNELKFLFGESGSNLASALMGSASEAINATSSVLNEAGSMLAGGIVGSLADRGVNSVVNGGKIIFPEIWSNSTYDKSYSIEIKLRSPDHDNLSIFLNILKPYCKLLSLVLPRSLPNNNRNASIDPNSYYAPFLVKAYSKGLFAIDMGIISSMSVNKGAQCCWNDDGLPTQIDITLEIKDLYNHMAMTSISIGGNSKSGGLKNPIPTIKGVVCNTAYMDFLANMAGLNIGQMEMGRRLVMAYYLGQNLIGTASAGIFTRLDQMISITLNRLYDII